jgi:hypothetical protein
MKKATFRIDYSDPRTPSLLHDIHTWYAGSCCSTSTAARDRSGTGAGLRDVGHRREQPAQLDRGRALAPVVRCVATGSTERRTAQASLAHWRRQADHSRRGHHNNRHSSLAWK